MNQSVSQSSSRQMTDCQAAISVVETTRYIKDLLQSLHDIAHSQGQTNLAHFIKAAASQASAEIEKAR